MIAMLKQSPPMTTTATTGVAVNATEFLEQLFALSAVGDTTAMLALIRAARKAAGPRPRNKARQKESSGPTRTRPLDRRDWWLIELDMPDAAKSSVERALHAAGICRNELLTAGDLCKWSAADLREMGATPTAVEELRRALAAIKLRLRGER